MGGTLCFLCLLVGCFRAHAAPERGEQVENSSSFVYNNYMASLSTSPEPFSGTYGHYHALTANDLPALRATNAQMLLVSLKPCSAYAPHYQMNAGETLYVKSGEMTAVLLADGGKLQHSLATGDVLTVPAGAMHAYLNPNCQDSEAIVLLTSADPVRVYPADQALSMPQQALISGFGLTNYTAFRDPVNLPKSHLYSLNDPACVARCKALTDLATPAAAPAAVPAAAPARASRRLGSTGAAQAAAQAPARRELEQRKKLQQRRRRQQQQQQQQRGLKSAADAVSGNGGSKSSSRGDGSAAAVLPSHAEAGRRQLLNHVIYNDYMGSLLQSPSSIDNKYASRRQLTHNEMDGLSETETQAVFTEFKACSMSAMHFQLDADEFTTVLTGTIDMILLVNGTRKVVRTMQPGDVAVIPRGVVHYFANANCDPNTMLVLFNSKYPHRIYPLTNLMDMPQEVLTAAFGLEGGPAGYPGWEASIDVPSSQLGSLSDPQCTARCSDSAAAAAVAQAGVATEAPEGEGTTGTTGGAGR